MKHPNRSDLAPFFEAQSVALIGSLREGEGEGEAYWVIHNMLQLGYRGAIYPVNPSYTQAHGIKAYPSVLEVEGPIDLAMIITPPVTVAAIVEQCARKGIRAVIVGTEGFAEASEDGARLQRELVGLARTLGVRLLGPNTIGTLNTRTNLTTNQYLIGYNGIKSGNIAYGSQTGFIGAQGQPLEDRAYPVSKMCDFGNKCDLDEADLLDYLRDDPDTDVIAIHLEGVNEGQRLMQALRRTTPDKPVVVFKTARTEPGARASASHTGSLAGKEEVYDSAFRQCGAVVVHTLQEYWDVPKIFAYQPLPRGNRLAMTTPTGGVGVMATDAAVRAGLTIAQLSDSTLEKLARLSDKLNKNPVDLGPTMVLTDQPLAVYQNSITALLEDEGVDCVTLILYAGAIGSIDETVGMVAGVRQRRSKPVTVWVYGTSMSMREEMARRFEGMGLPTYVDLETAVKAHGLAAQYARYREEVSRMAGTES